MLFIVSHLDLHTSNPSGADEVQVAVDKAPGMKCERCWRYVPALRTDADWAGICDRCVAALAETVNS
jgi:isoleucyl-tRNA synthetase